MTIVNIVPDCNVIISVAEQVGPGFTWAEFNRHGMWGTGNPAMQTMMILFARQWNHVYFRVSWSNHIRDTVAHVLHDRFYWTTGECDHFLDLIQRDLVDASGGTYLHPVAEGYYRMDDHEDSCVFETCRRVAESGLTVFITDDRSFLSLFNSTAQKIHRRNLIAVSTARFVRMQEGFGTTGC